MMKIKQLLPLGIILFALASCSSDDESSPMDSSIMTQQGVEKGECILKLNGEGIDDCSSATYKSVSGESNKMTMSISGLRPDETIDIDVDLVAEPTAINFSGVKIENHDTIRVSGTYMNLWRDKEGTTKKPRVRANVEFATSNSLTDKTSGYVFDFKNGCMAGVGSMGDTEQDEVAEMMSRNYTETLDAMKIIFGTDGLMKVYELPKDSTEYEYSDAIRYWSTASGIVLDMTEAQSKNFYTFWIGDVSSLSDYTPIFTESSTKSGSYPLNVSTAGLNVNSVGCIHFYIDKDVSYNAMLLYSQCKGESFATAEEKTYLQTIIDKGSMYTWIAPYVER